MNRTLTIAHRELSAYFATPVGYVVLALFLFVSGFYFWASILHQTGEANLRPFFDFTFFLILFIAPAISMRLISEDMRTGTIETLMTCPVSDSEVIIGKWLGAMGFFTLMLVPSFLYVFALELYADPDYGMILCGYLGLLLVGGLYLSAGLLASAFWPSQILAYLVALFFWLVFFGMTAWLPGRLPDPWPDVLFWMSVSKRFGDSFSKGVIDSSSIVYFLSGIFLFLTAATKVVESRRWR